MNRPAPAIIPAFGCRAALRSPSSPPAIRSQEPRCTCHEWLRRLRQLRGDRTRGDPVPLVLQGRHHPESLRMGSIGAQVAHHRDRKTSKSPAGRHMNAGGSRTKSILIAALGGEGGGVLSDWTLTAIRNAGYLAQST